MIRTAYLLLTAFIGSAWGALPKATVASYLEYDWYYTEVVIFRHRDVDANENLLHTEMRRFPFRLQSFELDTSAEFEYPTLDLSDGLPPSLPGWMIKEDSPLALPESEAGPRLANPTHHIAIPTGLLSPELPSEMDPAAIDKGKKNLENVTREAFSKFEEALTRNSLRWLSNELALLKDVARMRQSGQFNVLHHGRWLQAVPGRNLETPFLIQLGKRMSDGHHEIEGTLGVTLGRYLHFGADLCVHSDPTPLDGVIGDAIVNGRVGYARLEEQRRMRSNETHYLDHPQIGIVVRIEPLEVPPALVDLVRTINESED